ncbi:translation initiation factor 2 [Solibacillus sp. A46]|uniref:Translation initiation factor 2 n=1 Tax=Solibacillus faecavium TaxID=2762221 RepID=A0ABR8XVM8_9BACL|nr:translation initiation factor 2 [Solibacillus faecavium]MBD8035948.1 translation initiation factor 2 [Solibacillus faecavium]
MNKNNDLLKLCMIFAIIGIVFIVFNGHFANAFGSVWLQSNGGIMDTEEYFFMKTSYANASLVIGGILFSVSFLAMIFSWYQMKNK